MNCKHRICWLYFVTIIALLLSFETIAQNHLYTTEQFGIEGAMLGGAVTSGDNDVSMVFYNPGAIHKLSSQFSISFIQPTARTYGFENFWGNSGNTKLDTDLGLKSSLISVKTKFKKLNLAFLRFRKSELEDEFSSKFETLENNQLTTRYFDYQYTGRDSWYGIGSNMKLAAGLYVGLSQFLSISRFTYANNILSKESILDPDEQLVQYFNTEFEGNYQNTGFITKIGLLFDTKKHDIGLTITTPLYSRLRRSGDLFVNAVNTENGATNVDQIIEEDLSPDIRTPWEFNLGYSYELNENQKLWFNASYHSEISDYTMVNIVSRGTQIPWRNGSKEVMNFSIGYSHHISQYLQLSCAFRTNNFAYENKLNTANRLRNVVLDGDHLHYVIGSKFRFRKNTILLAVDYGRITNVSGQNNFDQISNIERLSPDLSNLKKNSVSILLTYGFIIDEIRKLRSN